MAGKQKIAKKDLARLGLRVSLKSMMPSPAVAKLSSAFIGIIRSFHCERQPPLHLIPSSQHSLLPLPIDAAAANTSNNHVPLAPSEIQKTFLESGINKVAFIRHGNTAPASNDFERALTELGRSQSRAAGASYGIALYPFNDEALCSSAPRCLETANLFLESMVETMQQQQDGVGEYVMPKLSLQSQLHDRAMQPAGSRLFAKTGYAPIRSYLENENLDDAETARVVLGGYARSSLDIMFDVVQNGRLQKPTTDIDKTLLFFAHAVYLPSAALCLAVALDCNDGIDMILDTNTQEAEGYCIDVDNENVTLLCRPTK